MNYDTKNCFSLLPCGLCRLTNAMCPFAEGNSREQSNGIFSPIDDHLIALKYQCDKFMAEHTYKKVEE